MKDIIFFTRAWSFFSEKDTFNMKSKFFVKEIVLLNQPTQAKFKVRDSSLTYFYSDSKCSKINYRNHGRMYK